MVGEIPMQMWTCFDIDYIRSHLDDILDQKGELTIWQSSGGKDREKLKAHLYQVDKTEITIELAPGESTLFSATDPLYIHSSFNDTIFKRDHFKKNGRLISFKFPLEIRMKEKRRILRYPYRYQDSKVVAFNTPHPTDPSQPNVKMSSILIDISIEGISFVLSDRELRTLPIGTDLYITRLTDQILPNAHLAKILYISPYRVNKKGQEYNSSGMIKIGAKFLEPLESISYKSIISLVTKKQTRIKGLDVEGFNGLDYEDQERALRKIAEDNFILSNKIRDSIEQLDRLRYLTTSMKQQFLLDVNKDLLAAALRLSSKELIYDLLIDVSDRMREEFLYKLNEQKPASAVQKAQEEICKFILKKEKAGELILDPTAFEQYV